MHEDCETEPQVPCGTLSICLLSQECGSISVSPVLHAHPLISCKQHGVNGWIPDHLLLPLLCATYPFTSPVLYALTSAVPQTQSGLWRTVKFPEVRCRFVVLGLIHFCCGRVGHMDHG